MFNLKCNLEWLIKRELATYEIQKSLVKILNKIDSFVATSSDIDAAKRKMENRVKIIQRYNEARDENKKFRRKVTLKTFEDSKYGIVMMHEDGSTYHYLLRSAKEHSIECWLYDLVNSSDCSVSISTRYREMTAKEFKREYYREVGGCDHNNNHRNSTHHHKLLATALDQIKVDNVIHYTYSKWETQEGLAAYNPDMLWLFASKSKLVKINGVLKGLGEYSTDGHTASWFGVNFDLSNSPNISYNRHLHPRGWVIGQNGVVYPIKYAKCKGLLVQGLIENSSALAVIGRVSDTNIVFSHSIGYYDSSKYEVLNYKLVSSENVVVTKYNKRECKSDCVFVDRYNSWVLSNECIKIGDVYELSSECISINGVSVHKSSKDIATCKCCGYIDLEDKFLPINNKVLSSPLVCRSCESKAHSRLIRMCYSTDVINHRGFGNTSMKINNEPVYLGLELEVKGKFSDHGNILKLNTFAASSQDFCVATRDGSLDDHAGVEYIFRPEGLINQKRNVKLLCDAISEAVHKSSGDGYGLHIHVSNHFLTGSDTLKIDNFVSLFEDYFRKVGARPETEYQVKKRINHTCDLGEFVESKYKMVNIGKCGTIEYRFPKSIVDEVHINMNMELALATTLFCKYELSHAKLNVYDLSTSALRAFIDYVSINKKKYPLLNAENNANIDLNNLGKYSKYCKVDISSYSLTEDETYLLAV